MRRVIIESPYAARIGHWPAFLDRWQNRRYLKRCILDCLGRNEAPFTSLFYTLALNDNLAVDRRIGMEAGWEWMSRADCVVVYTDRGISAGMMLGVQRARKLGIRIEQRFFEKPLASIPNVG